MDQITRRNVIAAGIATGALLLSGMRPALANLVPLSWHEFTVFINEYMDQNRDRIEIASNLNGGWEKWFQTELAIHILMKNKSYDLLKEQYVFTGGSQETVDFVLSGTNVSAATVLIELKCQNILSASSLKSKMKIDEAKLKKSNLADVYRTKNVNRYTVVATKNDLSNKAASGYSILPFDPPKSNNHTNNTADNDAKKNNNNSTHNNNNINSTNNNTNNMQVDSPPLRIYYQEITA